MRAKPEQTGTLPNLTEPTPLNYAALQARMPAVQSDHPKPTALMQRYPRTGI